MKVAPTIEQLEEKLEKIANKNSWTEYTVLVLDFGQIHFEVSRNGKVEEIRFENRYRFADFVSGLSTID